MSLLQRIEECHRWNPDDYRPFLIGGEQFGRITDDFAARLEAYDGVFDAGRQGLSLAGHLKTCEARSAAVEEVLLELRGQGLIPRWRDEPYAIGRGWGVPPLMLLERGAVPLFGTRGYGIHVNGYVRKGGALHLWVGRRAKDKATAPGKFDHLVAGGQPHGLSLRDNLAKEAWEEASVPREIAERAVPVGAVAYVTERTEGLRDDVLFCYDLELPPDFVPKNTDGEVEEFSLWPIEEVKRALAETDGFKFNVALVNIDFLIRHGVIEPDEPDYLALIDGLRRTAPI